MAGSGTAHLRPDEDVLLRVENLVVEYRHGSHERVKAVSDVSFDVRRGETLGLVGESGCGKSTIARAVMQLPPPTSGSVSFSGQELTELDGKALREVRQHLQMIFQDPISSLNPRRRVRHLVAEGLRRYSPSKAEIPARVSAILEAVGLDPDLVADRRPREFSGGQCQRICIARALVLEPEFLICDEPVSALDVSVQAQILNLLADMKERFELTMLFIAHDLAVVKNVSERIAVMYLGKLCEIGPADTLQAEPLHPYTRILLDAIPEPDPNVTPRPSALYGDPPSAVDPPSGCRFRTRCSRSSQRCADVEPILEELRPGQFVACHHPLEVD